MLDKDLIKKSFSKASKTYDFHSIVQKDTARKLLEIVKRNGCYRSILELGCGTGFYSGLLRETYPHSRIVAVDLSQDMINLAKEKNPTIEFQTHDFENLPVEFYDDFQLITSNSSIHWINNPQKFIKKFVNFTNTPKKIIFSIFGNKTLYELKEIINYPITSSYFLTKDEWNNILLNTFNSNFSLNVETLTIIYPNLLSLLRSIKYTGVNIKKDKNFIWTKAKIEQAERDYFSKFGAIKATYEILFVEVF